MRENEKRTFMLLDVAVLAGSVNFADCAKGILQHSLNREMFVLNK